MKNAFLFAGISALTLALTACGEIHDNLSYPHIAVQVTRDGHPARGQDVGVAIRTHRDNPFTEPQPVVTNSRGVATADFPSHWANSQFTFPTKRTIPLEAPKPQYMVYARGQKMLITPKTPDTTYHWNGERWETQTSVALP